MGVVQVSFLPVLLAFVAKRRKQKLMARHVHSEGWGQVGDNEVPLTAAVKNIDPSRLVNSATVSFS